MRALIALLLLWPAVAAAQAPEWAGSLTLRLSEKYDNNVDLSALERAETRRADMVTEFGMAARAARTSARWDVDLGLRLRVDVPVREADRLRIYSSPDAFVAWQFATNHSLSLNTVGSCFSELFDDRFDVCRNLWGLAWRWSISDRFVLRLGIEKQDAYYFDTDALDYASNGPFVELRLPWSYDLLTWARLSLMVYDGALRSGTTIDDGHRTTAEIGVDWSPIPSVSVIATAQIQKDDAEAPVRQFGGPDFPDDALETDAQFNYFKGRATLLGTWRINNRFTVGADAEILRIGFYEAVIKGEEEPDRVDIRWLWSSFVKMRLTDSGLAARLRYLTRHNNSSARGASFENNIYSLGIEQRW